MSIFPKAHFTFSYTFVNVDEVLRRYNSQSFGERIRGEEVFNHLMGKLSEEGIIGKSGSKSIDKFEF
jgi:hypothetical protein